MVEDPATKDVFREMDGFVVLVSVLSALHQARSRKASTDTHAFTEALESARLAFAILSEAMRAHPVNKDYFEASQTCSMLRSSE
jgi:hypothetical protein